MIHLKKINLSFGDRTLFDNVSFSLQPNQKIGLVGRNGSGKTTLFKILANQQKIDSGQISISKDTKIAYMPQQVVLTSNKTIINEALAVFPSLSSDVEELTKLEKNIETTQDKKAKNKFLEHYAELQHKLYEHNYQEILTKTTKMITGLGFKEEQFDQPVSNLSVGWKMRLILAKLLLQDADFYLFDEPTNHLDLVAKDWFLDFLKNASFGFILVSHDKYFLDHLCDQIFEVRLGKLKTYKGNYSQFVIQREKDVALLEKKHEEQQKFVKKQMATIERFRASASKSRMAQSMLKSLEKMEKVELGQKQKTMKFGLPPTKRAGKIVLKVEDLAFSFDSKRIFHNASFHLERGHRAAIVAPNGTGKSTLLNVISGKYQPTNGSFEFGHNVQHVIFEQDQNQTLNPNKKILEEVEDSCVTSEARARVRGMLGAFLFPGDDVYKKISILSGGEKNRVAMVKLLLQNANFLILDEPTNHLDLESKEILLSVLKKFDGSILFVSHDRTFLNDLSTHILELTPNGITSYKGDYDSYLYQKEAQQPSKPDKKKNHQPGKVLAPQKSNKTTYEQQKKLKNLEKKIERLEKKLKQVSLELANLSYGSQQYQDKLEIMKDLETQLTDSLSLWEKKID